MRKGYRVNLDTSEKIEVFFYEKRPEGEWAFAYVPALAEDEHEDDLILDEYEIQYKKDGKLLTVKKYRFIIDVDKKAARLAVKTAKDALKEKVKNAEMEDNIQLKELKDIVADMRKFLFDD